MASTGIRGCGFRIAASPDTMAGSLVVLPPATDRLAGRGVEIGLDPHAAGVDRLDFVDAIVDLDLMDPAALTLDLGDDLAHAHPVGAGGIAGIVGANVLSSGASRGKGDDCETGEGGGWKDDAHDVLHCFCFSRRDPAALTQPLSPTLPDMAPAAIVSVLSGRPG